MVIVDEDFSLIYWFIDWFIELDNQGSAALDDLEEDGDELRAIQCKLNNAECADMVGVIDGFWLIGGLLR